MCIPCSLVGFGGELHATQALFGINQNIINSVLLKKLIGILLATSLYRSLLHGSRLFWTLMACQ